MLKRVVYTILLVIWMIIIFMFSNQGSNKSLSLSDNLTKNTINTVSKITGKETTNKDKKVKDSRFIVRKLAHFTLYFILGVLVLITLNSYGVSKNIVFYSVLFCFIYAISDEVHQLIRGDRTFRYLDIFIDTTGSFIGSFILNKKINKI